ncbi:MAG: DUF4886 domain-containing protein, partial [bacterium]|nr:DUF4886 domain-containing protein [Candidatus Limimorpha equi]
EHPLSSAASIDYPLIIPSNAKICRIFGTEAQVPILRQTGNVALSERICGNEAYINELLKSSDISIPQIYNAPIRQKNKETDTLKILCFGSSWFMDTWWYLNKIIADAGINAELHCYYMGHSKFSEWIQLYADDLTPFSGSESSRSASKNTSINGADWIITTYSSSGSYNAQAYRDDWYNDLVSGNWDIIAFQQGARQAPYWDLYWKNEWSDIVDIVKKHCNPNTHIAFNSTWTPAVQNTTDMAPYPATKAGQKEWQKANWENTKRFMALSGLYNVSPCGKAMRLLRDSDYNTQLDLADDGLHPNNGLPIYVLGGVFYETFIAPMFGISFKDINWIPTTATQKVSVSGQTWTPLPTDTTDLKNIVMNSMAKRFSE